MLGFPIGIMALVVVSVIIYFGLAHRVLDRLRLSDKGALAVLAAIIIGSFITIPIYSGRIGVSLNIGGALIPFGLAIYVLAKAGTGKEWLRAIIASLVTGVVVFYIGSVLMTGDPRSSIDRLDPMYVYPIIGGLTAYIAGRSRRAAFIAGTLGVLLLDVFNLIYLVGTGTPGQVSFGGAGAYDSVIISGIIAVLLAEVIGETRERLQGGPESKGRPKELLKNLKNTEYATSLGLDKEEDSNEK